MSTKKYEFYINAAIGALAFGTIFCVLQVMSSIPDVYFSYSTDECVLVLNYHEDDNYSCDNLPTKFNHVWVQ